MLSNPWAISVSGWVVGLPIPRHQLVDAVLPPAVDQAGKQVSEIGLRIDVVQLCCLCRPPNYAERFRNDAWLSSAVGCCVAVGSVPFGIVWSLRAPLGRQVIGRWGGSGFGCRPDMA